MLRALAFSVVFGSVMAACGASAPPAEGPAATAGAKEPPAAADPDPSSAPAAAAAGTGQSAAQEPAAAGSAAPAGSGGDRGERTTESIHAIVTEHRGPVRACYEAARKQLPDLRGRLTIKFVIDPEGKVKSAEHNLERSDIKAPAVVKCAIDTISGLTFPPHPKGLETTVNFPFDFKP